MLVSYCGQVLAANKFSPAFRRYLGVSGKLALVVTSSLAAFSVVSETTLVDESRRIRHENYRQRHNIADGHDTQAAIGVANSASDAVAVGGECVSARTPHAKRAHTVCTAPRSTSPHRVHTRSLAPTACNFAYLSRHILVSCFV